SAARIARLQGIPAGTVRWRLSQAIDDLRVRLDERHGGRRRAWLLALAPLARRRLGLAGPAIATAAVLAVIAAGAVLVARTPLPPGRYGLTAVAPPHAPASLPGVTVVPGDRLAGLTLHLGAGGALVRGRVLDTGAGAIPGAWLRARPASNDDEPGPLYQVTGG